MPRYSGLVADCSITTNREYTAIWFVQKPKIIVPLKTLKPSYLKYGAKIELKFCCACFFVYFYLEQPFSFKAVCGYLSASE